MRFEGNVSNFHLDVSGGTVQSRISSPISNWR
jgi:hypothetical protein